MKTVRMIAEEAAIKMNRAAGMWDVVSVQEIDAIAKVMVSNYGWSMVDLCTADVLDAACNILDVDFDQSEKARDWVNELNAQNLKHKMTDLCQRIEKSFELED